MQSLENNIQNKTFKFVCCFLKFSSCSPSLATIVELHITHRLHTKHTFTKENKKPQRKNKQEIITLQLPCISTITPCL